MQYIPGQTILNSILPFSKRNRSQLDNDDRRLDEAEILSNSDLNISVIEFNGNMSQIMTKYKALFIDMDSLSISSLMTALGFDKNREDYPLSNGDKIDLLWWLYIGEKDITPYEIKRKLSKAFKSSNRALLKELSSKYIIDGQMRRNELIFLYVIGRGAPSSPPNITGTNLSAYEVLNKAPSQTIMSLWVRLEEMNYYNGDIGPYQYLSAFFPNTSMIALQMNENNYKEIDKIYGLSLLLEENDQNNMITITEELSDYEAKGIFTREANVLNNFPNTRSDIQLYKHYTSSELIQHYGYVRPYTYSNDEIIRYLAYGHVEPDTYNNEIEEYPRWAFTLTNNSAIGGCQNKDFMDPIDQEPFNLVPRKYDWISYGEPGNWRCYPLQYIEESIQGVIDGPNGTYEALDNARVVVRDYDPMLPNRFPPFSDGTRLVEDLPRVKILELYNLLTLTLREGVYDDMNNMIDLTEITRIKSIVKKIVSKFQIILSDQSAKLRVVREKAVLYQTLSDEKKVMVIGYFLRMMLIGMIMRKWKDMSEYPYVWIDSGGNRLTDCERDLLVGHAGKPYFSLREQLLKPENANVKSLTLDLPMVDVKNDTREFNIYTNPSYSPFTKENDGNMIDVLLRSALAGRFCMGAANKKFIGTAWFYLTQFLGLNDDQFSEYLTQYWRYLKGQGYILNGVDIFADMKSFPFDISQLENDWHWDVEEGRAAEQANEI